MFSWRHRTKVIRSSTAASLSRHSRDTCYEHLGGSRVTRVAVVPLCFFPACASQKDLWASCILLPCFGPQEHCFGPHSRPRAESEARHGAIAALPWSLTLSWKSTRTSASLCTATASVRDPSFHGIAGTSAVRHIRVKQGVWKDVTSSCAKAKLTFIQALSLCQDNRTSLMYMCAGEFFRASWHHGNHGMSEAADTVLTNFASSRHPHTLRLCLFRLPLNICCDGGPCKAQKKAGFELGLRGHPPSGHLL